MKTISTPKKLPVSIIYTSIFTALTVTALIVIAISNTTNATSTAGFKSGRIIDDVIFTNKSTMSVNDIQNFLNSKVPTCDTNGAQQSEMNNTGVPDYNGNGSIQRWEWGKYKYDQTTFPCLKDYTQDGISAAQLVYDASQTYSINPQVMIVLLQKEQGLVTDTWPLNVQYRSATGYGCPDTAACDSKYYGLKNQLNWAATMFRAILDNSPTWYTPYLLGENYIQYNPNSSCGGSTVNIENRSTQALYNYTPYQPNQAALDAGWGTANCGAYGNRNFYLYFTSWFGSIHGTKIIKSDSSPTIYVYSQGKKTPIPNLTTFNAYGFNKVSVMVVSQAYLDSLETTSPLSNLSRYSNGAIQLIDEGRRYTVTSYDQCTAWGLSCTDPYVVNTLDDDIFSTTIWAGALQPLMYHNGGIYKLENGHKLPFLNLNAITQNNYNFGQISTITSTTNSSHSLGQILPSNDTSFKLKTGEIIVYAKGQYVKVANLETFYRWGLDRLYYSTLPVSSWDTSPPTPSNTLIDGYITQGGKKYLIDNGKKIDVTLAPSSWPAAPAASDYMASLIGRLNTVIISSQTCLRTPSGSIFLAEGSQRRNIRLVEDIYLLGCYGQATIPVSEASLSILADGPAKLSSSRLFKKAGSPEIYMEAGNNASYHIPTSAHIDAFGERASDIATVDNLTLSNYASIGNASSVAGNASLATYFVYTPGGTKYYLNDTTFTEWGLNKSSIPTYDRRIGDENTTKPMTRFARTSDGTIYYAEGGSAHLITSYSAFERLGGTSLNTVNVLDDFINILPKGNDIS